MDHRRGWSARRKAALLLAIDYGLIAPDEAASRFGLSDEVLTVWRRHFKAYGWPELRTTRLQIQRQRARAVAGRGPLRVAAAAPCREPATTVWRDGHKTDCIVKPGQMVDKRPVAAAAGGAQEEQASQASALGMHLRPLTGSLRKQLHLTNDAGGVIVSGVDDGSAADQVGLTNGDVILLINRQPIFTPDEAAARLEDAARSPEKPALLLLNRDGVTAYFRMPLDGHQG